MIRRLAAAVLLLGLVPATALPSDLNARIKAEQAKKAAIDQQLHQKRAELHAATVRVTNLQGALDQTNRSIGEVNSRLGSLAAQSAETQRRLDFNTIQLNAARKTLALHDDLLKRRLVDTYERGDLGYLSVLLAAKSFSDFVERWQDLGLLIAANQRAVRERRAAEKKVRLAQQALQATQSQLEAQQLAQQRARNQLDILAQERGNLVALADAQRHHVAGQVAEMEGLSQAENDQLVALIREREAQIAAARRAAGITTPETAPGAIAWPVTGVITSPFGWRRSPFGSGAEFHQGLDIGANMGTPVKAAAAGTVISAGWYGGYGNYILIDHGGGMSTGYGHLSRIDVSNGQQVQRGQLIGAVGSTGASTGPHLHFEVRISGKPVDPTAYLH
ncbi:MAG TPA: peptidoglycan DD-metalloendopeptidase family protein [Candidatus Rubrimentiphilum sp.]|nr:peptidoglycan DD-metalloendopeptidase family protein [Candidatus Rubrimentiphilum sp.]